MLNFKKLFATIFFIVGYIEYKSHRDTQENIFEYKGKGQSHGNR